MYDVKPKIQFLKKHLDSVLLIHYGSSGIDPDSDAAFSPRVTSIAVLHAESSTMHSFSLHLVAETLKVPKEGIESHYDELEAQMLKDFYKFAQDNQSANWVHWKMSNVVFGFPSLAHRYKVLTGEDAPVIEDTRRFNLSTLISEFYGENCVDNPKMYKLMELNGGLHRDVLNGSEEATAFKSKDYRKLHSSTMAKVYWFRDILYALFQRKVKTQRANFQNKVNSFLELAAVKLIGFVAVLFTLVQLGTYIFSFFD